MAKLTLHYKLLEPLNEAHMKAISRAGGIYGFTLVRLNKAMDGIIVEIDFTRIRVPEAEAKLAQLGLPLARVVVEPSPGVVQG
ncbi:MAG: hypothetical protein LC114_19245 [Bryobacterales bacterium]|nr:hypothetical protein [Bryobacterales bacterium]